MSKAKPRDDRLLQVHQLHLGLYVRIARKLKLTPGYVSRVANGYRKNDAVMTALVKELRKLSDAA